jgi:hypothetical protein
MLQQGKAKVGDYVMGDAEADEHYSITGKGWVGYVTRLDFAKEEVDIAAIDEHGEARLDRVFTGLNPKFFSVISKDVAIHQANTEERDLIKEGFRYVLFYYAYNGGKRENFVIPIKSLDVLHGKIKQCISEDHAYPGSFRLFEVGREVPVRIALQVLVEGKEIKPAISSTSDIEKDKLAEMLVNGLGELLDKMSHPVPKIDNKKSLESLPEKGIVPPLESDVEKGITGGFKPVDKKTKKKK